MPFYQKLKKIFNYIANTAAIGIILLYRAIFSPTVGILRFIPRYPRPTCIFYPTCSEYGLQSFRKYPFFKAFKQTVHRISRCHPGNEPQIDHP